MTERSYLLVYCSTPGEGLEFIAQPMGILLLGAILEKMGLTVKCLDERIHGAEEIREGIQQADVVGFSTMTPYVERAQDWARYARELGKITMIGGPHATVDPDSVLDSKLFDFVFAGEAEISITEVLPHLDDKEKLKEVAGLGFHDDAGNRILTEVRPFNKDLDALPFPARHLLPMDEYFRRNKERLIYVFTSRGCPYSCVFCEKETYGRGFRPRSVDNVCDELEQLLAEYQPGAVLFIDELFTTQRKRVFALCEEIVRRKIEVNWVCETRVDRIDYEMMMAMREAGMRLIYFGVETGSPASLVTLKKRFTLEQIIETLKTARKAHLWTKIFLIIGTPKETAEDIELTAKMLRTGMPDQARCALFNPLKGSEAFTLYRDRIDPELINKEFVASGGTPYVHENFTVEELNAAKQKLLSEYEEWYDRPGQRFKRWLSRMRFYLTNPSWLKRRLARAG